MTKRFANPLVRDLLAVAEELAASNLGGKRQAAAYRRAVSTAYYAVFHALCYLCVDGLKLWSASDDLEPIYRSIDHGVTKTKRLSDPAKDIDPTIDRLGRIFATLHQARQDADYRPPGKFEINRNQASVFIKEAEEAIALIEALEPKPRLLLSILLITNKRSK